jgi:hypothetical protein
MTNIDCSFRDFCQLLFTKIKIAFEGVVELEGAAVQVFEKKAKVPKEEASSPGATN